MLGIVCFLRLCLGKSAVSDFAISTLEFKAQEAESVITEVLLFILCADVYGETVS